MGLKRRRRRRRPRHMNVQMKESEVLPPQWMECVVVGCGVLTIILSTMQLTTAATLSTVFVLGWLTQEKVQGIWLGDKTSFRPHSHTGLLLGNLLIPMVTASTSFWTSQDGPSPVNLYQLMPFVLCLITPVALLLCSVMRFRLPTEYRFAYHLWILPVFGLQVGTFLLEDRMMIYVGAVMTTIISAYYFFTRLLFFLPGSFTLGEVILVSHSLALLTLLASHSMTAGSGELLTCLQVLVLGCIIIALTVFPVVRNLQSLPRRCQLHGGKDPASGKLATKEVERSHLKLSLYFYLCLAAAIVFILLPWLGLLLGQEPLQWGVLFVLATRTRMLVLCLWVVMVIGAVGVVMLCGSSSTIIRKYFHLLAICIYVPGILYDVHLLHLASSGTLFIFVILEFLRIFRVWPLGGALHEAFKVFLDDQDCGVAILTHIYLLVGMALPVWIYVETAEDRHSGTSLAIYSGVLSLGVGDSAASIVGSVYGKFRWPGSKKTLEGTCAAMVSQLAACCLLYLLDPRLATPQGWGAIAWVVLLTSVLEAVTAQIDNLVLPLFMYSLLVNLT